MIKSKSIFSRIRISTMLLVFILTSILGYGQQDTLTGAYDKLIIKSGLHVINKPLSVKDLLEIQPGAKLQLENNAVIICEGQLLVDGKLDNNIEIFGKDKNEGVGIIIRGKDSSFNNPININNTIFKNLQLPLLFDFGWTRSRVNISNNLFLGNIGKVSVLQILNPPFNVNTDTNYIEFNIQHNTFSYNQSGIYFEDLKSDYIKFTISDNLFYRNNIYGLNTYNISNNFLYGRVDEMYNRFSPKINNNSFIYNYLVDNVTERVVQSANLGVYGTEQIINVDKNYFGTDKADQILNSIYDKRLNYNSPKANFEPFLNIPNDTMPTHVYSVLNPDKTPYFDTIPSVNVNGLILKSNNPVQFTNSILRHTYYKDDSSLLKIDTVLKFTVEQVDIDYKLVVSNNNSDLKKPGYYVISNILSKNGLYVPDVRIGYNKYLDEQYRRNVIHDSLISKLITDTSIAKPKAVDSIKNSFQKIDGPVKSKIELGLMAGGSIFTGTISNKGNLLSNDINMNISFMFNYLLNSNLSTSLSIESFKLSNSDLNSNNNDQIARGMSFITNVLAISPAIYYDFVDNRLNTKARKLRPSLGVGFNLMSFTPSGYYNEVLYNLQSLGTGGQYADSTGKPYSLSTFGYFLGFKLKYQFTKLNAIGFQFSFHKSMSNYLDDVGGDIYPTVSSILNSKIENKDAAIYFSNPSFRNVTGQYRNSPDPANDSYINFGLFYSRKLFK